MVTCKSIVVARTDRLGDVMMALPSLALLRKALPAVEITLLCRPEIAALLTPTLSKLNITAQGAKLSRTDEWKRWWNEKDCDAALLLFPEKALSLGAFLARVPLRVGPFSKLISLLVLNRGQWQRRSRGERNEAQYNLDLTRHLLESLHVAIPEIPPVSIAINESEAQKAKKLLESKGVRGPYYVVHPGMGGSALNPSASHYEKIIKTVLQKTGRQVVVTVGPAAKDLLMAQQLANSGAVFIQNISLGTLLEVFRASQGVIAPSTGPVHLAHYSGVKTIGLFSPVPSHHPNRWAPWGGSGDCRILFPDPECPARKDCLGSRCDKFDCMEQFPWAQRVEAALTDRTT